MTRPRVALFSELPTPYRWPVFERLLADGSIDLRVFFMASGEPDRDWEFPFRPERRVRFLPGATLSFAGRHTVHYHVNPGVFGVLRRGTFDVTVFPGWGMFASHGGALWCRVHRRPYVLFSETHGLTPRRASSRLLKRLILPVLVGGASAWLAAGTAAAEYLARYGARPERTFPFPNSPDVDALARAAEQSRPGRNSFRAARGADAVPVALFVGRLLPVKRVDLLLRAAAATRRGGHQMSLWIAGTGPERSRLEHLAGREGLADARFLGAVAYSDLPALYAAADFLVLPSDHEPWGAVVGEALSCGLPAVVSDAVGAGVDLVVPERTGFVFPRGDAAALAGTMARLVSDGALRARLGAEGCRHARRFDHAACVRGFLAAVSVACGRVSR